MAKASRTNRSSAPRRYGRADKRQPKTWGVRRNVGILGSAIVVLAVGAILIAQRSADVPGVQVYPDQPYQHTTGPVSYPQNPPAGGNHNPVWLNCGIYDQPVPNENAVHSLEHGAVWITYQSDLPQAAVDQLRGLVRAHSFVILSPYPNLPVPVVASAWGVQLKLQGAGDARLPRFIAKYEQGPQAPETGGECSDGLGNPIE